MKGLKEFLEALEKDNILMEKVEKAQNDSAKIVEIAKNYGYEFTEDEFNDFLMEAVSGGRIDFKGIFTAMKKGLDNWAEDQIAEFAINNPKTTAWLIKTFYKK